MNVVIVLLSNETLFLTRQDRFQWQQIWLASSPFELLRRRRDILWMAVTIGNSDAGDASQWLCVRNETDVLWYCILWRNTNTNSWKARSFENGSSGKYSLVMLHRWSFDQWLHPCQSSATHKNARSMFFGFAQGCQMLMIWKYTSILIKNIPMQGKLKT